MAEVLVIGGGVSGLAAGIFAERNGHHATVCEKYAVAGGNLTSWKRQGYTIDPCLHWLTGTNKNTVIYKMWEDLGALGNTEIYRPEFLFEVEHEGQTLGLYRSLDETVAKMLEISPKDKHEIKSFEKATKAMLSMLGTFGPEKNQKLNKFQMLPYYPALLKYYLNNCGDLAKKCSHPLLQKFFSYLMGTYMNGVDFAFVAATFVGDNADLPRGLSKPMAERMVNALKERGGTLLLNKEAAEVLYEGDKATGVRFTDGEVLTADAVILAIEPATAFGKLLPYEFMPKGLKKQFENPAYVRFSSYHAQFACDKDRLPFRENFIIDVPEKYREILHNHRMTIRSFDFEPSFSPEGKSTLQAMVYCYEDGCKRFIDLKEQNPEAYKKEKAAYSQAMMEIIEEKYPELKGCLTLLDAWTPATYKRYTGALYGNYQGFINPKGKPPKKHDNHIPGLQNCYMASQWRMSPGGLPVAASAGRKAVFSMDGVIR